MSCKSQNDGKTSRGKNTNGKPSQGNALLGYGDLLGEIKERVRSAQYEALRAVNWKLIGLYWDIGRMIVERQAKEKWGRAIVEQIAKRSTV